MSRVSGRCEFCNSEEVPLVEAGELGGLFDNLLSMYEVADSYETGESLISLIQWHWEVFDEDVLDEDKQVQLLEEIANSDWDDDDGEPMLNARELYSPPALRQFHTTHRERWEEFCSDVRENPQTEVPFTDWFEENFVEFEVHLPIGATFFRARRGFQPGDYEERTPFQGNDIGAPPADKALSGRANVEGHRVVYCADEEKTAIAEVRPPRGYYVSLGTLRLNREARILDLTKNVEELNPFTRESLAWDVEVRGLLDAFAEEMSRPLERDDDPTHYIPCQRLSEYIRDAGYDGIRYPSALDPEGRNVVFFDPAIVGVTDSKLVKITALSFEFEVDQTPPVTGITLLQKGLKPAAMTPIPTQQTPTQSTAATPAGNTSSQPSHAAGEK